MSLDVPNLDARNLHYSQAYIYILRGCGEFPSSPPTAPSLGLSSTLDRDIYYRGLCCNHNNIRLIHYQGMLTAI